MSPVSSPVTPPAPAAPDPPPPSSKASDVTSSQRPSTPPPSSAPLMSAAVASLTPCILSTPTLADPTLRRLNPRLTPGLRDMIRAMGHFQTDPATPNLGTVGRTPDLAGLYVPLSNQGTPALRDLSVGNHLDSAEEADFDTDHTAEMHALFSSYVSPMDVQSLTPGLSSFPGHYNTLSLMSSPDLRIPTTVYSQLTPGLSSATTATSAASTGSTRSPDPCTVSSEPRSSPRPPSSGLTPYTSGPLPKSQLSDTLTPLVNAGVKRKREAEEQPSATKDQQSGDDGHRTASAAPIRAAGTAASIRAAGVAALPSGGTNRGARALPSMIPLPVPVGVSGPTVNGRREGGPSFARPMAWVPSPNGPNLVPVQFLAQHGIPPYALMPGMQAAAVAAHAHSQSQSPTAVTATAVLGPHNNRKRRRRASPDDCACTAEQARRNRAKAMIRLKQKKSVRSYEKTVRYACRKKIAMVRPRVNGRFATKEEVEQFKRTGRFIS